MTEDTEKLRDALEQLKFEALTADWLAEIEDYIFYMRGLINGLEDALESYEEVYRARESTGKPS